MKERETLRDAFARGELLRLMGAHDGLTAKLADRHGFEGIWASGLAISSSYGLPDSGLLSLTEVHAASVTMRAVTDLPIVADIDSGFGDADVITRVVRVYESAGIDAVCIEDKSYPKRNSFLPGNELEDPTIAAGKIAAAKAAQRSGDFVVIARQESLIAEVGMDDAIERAWMYLDAGADALLIHSRRSGPSEVAEYCRRMRGSGCSVPILAIPTTYYSATASELHGYGVSAVVYANQLIRASLRAMENVLESFAVHDSSAGVETEIATLSELFTIVDMGAVAAGVAEASQRRGVA